MTINLTREDFEQAIKSGASVFEGNTIPDTGKPSGRYYRFIRVPLANGEHKVAYNFVAAYAGGSDFFLAKKCERHRIGIVR